MYAQKYYEQNLADDMLRYIIEDFESRQISALYDIFVTGEWSGAGEAQGWYATLGIPFNDWLKLWLKYDAYQDDACWGSTRSIYSISPNIQIHKNLWFQPRVAYVHDRTLDTNWTEASVELGVRF